MLEHYYVRPDTIDRIRTSWIIVPRWCLRALGNFAPVSSENVDEKHPPSLQGRTSIEPLPSGRCPAEGRCEATRRPPPLRPPLSFP